jgi:V/A-type H+-transporting ATPase subunit C
MTSGGVSGYAAVQARVRARYADRIPPEKWAELARAADLKTLIGLLRGTVYGPYLAAVAEQNLTPRRTVFQLEGRVADSYGMIIKWAPARSRAVLLQLYRRFEVDNLKAVLRGIETGSAWERIQFVLFPFGPVAVLPAREMAEAGDVHRAVEKLRGTPYFETLDHALDRYDSEHSLFPLEVALDLAYWRTLWAEVQRLPGSDQKQSVHIVGSLMDMNNLFWAIRYRVYHRLSEEEIINYTLPFGYQIHDEDIRRIAAGEDIPAIVERLYPEWGDLENLLKEPRRGLPILRVRLERRIMEICRAVFIGDPFHIGIPIAFGLLSEMETQDLTVLIEAKAMGMPAMEFSPFLLAGEETPGGAGLP